MAGFFDKCLDSAVEQDILSKREAENIKSIYNEHYEFASRSGDPDPAATAKASTAKIFVDAAAWKRRNAKLALEARNDIAAYGETYRSPTLAGFGAEGPDIIGAHYNKLYNLGGFAKTSSFAGTVEAKYGLYMARLNELVAQFRKSKITGMRLNQAGAEDMVYETYGTSRTPEARAAADAVKLSLKESREDFNANGGNVKELQGPWLPQDHDPAAVLNGGRLTFLQRIGIGEGPSFQGWHDYIVPKLDLERMRDPLSGVPLSQATPDRLKELLKSAWDHITTAGWSDRKPTTQQYGIGPVYAQRQDHRFLHFKDADSWLAYNRDFGSGDPMAAVVKHLRGMAVDSAAMEILGPNPRATLEWMKQVELSEAGKFVAGKPSLYRGKFTGAQAKAQDFLQGGIAGDRLNALYDSIAGGAVASGRIARFFGDIRNWLTASQLGTTIASALPQDPIIDIAARRFSGIPATGAMSNILKNSFSKVPKDQAVRAGFITDEFRHVFGTEARYAGMLGGHDTTRWMAERTLNWSGLEQVTQGRKTKFQLDYMAATADRRDMSFEELGNEMPNFRRTMESYGLTEKDWDKIRSVEPHIAGEGSAGLLRPIDVADKVDRRLGERYLEVMLQQTERDVPSSNARSRAMFTLGTRPGTIAGEAVRSVMQYKAFSLSLMASQWEQMVITARSGQYGATAYAGGALVARSAAFAASLVLPLTMAGAAGIQLRNLAASRDLEDMSPSNWRFWIKAMQTGGGLGILGDFLFSDSNRFGQTPFESMLGPTAGFAADMSKLVVGEWQKDQTHFARDFINTGLGRYTPIVSSLWYIRMAYRRMLLDQLQFLADPEANKNWRQQEQALHRRTGQEHFWPSGEMLPRRAPGFAIPTR
jgi:hypothetical protein